MAFERLEPWGDGRADLRAGIIASTMANMHRHSESDPVLQPSDFMPKFWKEETEEPTTEEISAQLVAAFSKYC